MGPRASFDLLFLKAAHRCNRARFALLRRALAPRVTFGRGCDVWAGSLRFIGMGRAEFGDGAVVERGAFPAILEVDEGGLVRMGEGSWLRGKYRPNVITCFENARVEIGRGSLLNGTIISARERVTLGERCMVSWDTAILDSNLHPLANDEPMEPRPVTLGDFVMIASGTVVLSGVTIGAHTVVGARSVVTRDLPDHVLAAGVPARVIRTINDRDRCL